MFTTACYWTISWSYFQRIHPILKSYIRFCNRLNMYSKEPFSPHPTSRPQNYSTWTAFNIPCIWNLRTDHGMVTWDSFNKGIWDTTPSNAEVNNQYGCNKTAPHHSKACKWTTSHLHIYSTVNSCLIARIVGSNPDRHGCLLCMLCDVRYGSLCRAGHSTRGVLMSVVSLSVIMNSWQWGDPGPKGPLRYGKKKKTVNKTTISRLCHGSDGQLLVSHHGHSGSISCPYTLDLWWTK